LLALRFGWPLTFLARHHAGPFINLVRQNPGPSKSSFAIWSVKIQVRQNPVLQIQRPGVVKLFILPLSRPISKKGISKHKYLFFEDYPTG